MGAMCCKVSRDTNEKPDPNQEPDANQEPDSNEEPDANQEPDSNEEPDTNGEPDPNEDPETSPPADEEDRVSLSASSVYENMVILPYEDRIPPLFSISPDLSPTEEKVGLAGFMGAVGGEEDEGGVSEGSGAVETIEMLSVSSNDLAAQLQVIEDVATTYTETPDWNELIATLARN